jgi:hypothetical protein
MPNGWGSRSAAVALYAINLSNGNGFATVLLVYPGGL